MKHEEGFFMFHVFMFHARSSAKFARIFRPIFWLFSGWNWVAMMFSLRMLLTKGRP
jgi:hypothetical protein